MWQVERIFGAMKKRSLVLVVIALLGLLGAMVVSAQDAPPPGPRAINIKLDNLFPEGIEYNPTNDTFLISSLGGGGVYAITLDGRFSAFVQDQRLKATAGLHVDVRNNRLLVASTDLSGNGPVGLGIYNLSDGGAIDYVDLTGLTQGRHFINDVAVDDRGNAYVTDSFAGAIYRVDARGKASIFLQDPSFQGDFVLNGIDYNPDGYLVAVRAPGLIRIPLDDPQNFRDLRSKWDYSGADGLHFLPDGNLLVVSNSQGKVFAIASDDQYQSATPIGRFDTGTVFPTTVAARGEEIYVLYAHLDKMGNNFNDFRIVRVKFSALR
jgi:sugar lactone lactonase YvrE